MKPKILVAEDYDSNYQLVYAYLKKYATIVRAINGLEAVNTVKEDNFDLVLMDLKMPIMTGIEATTKIRQDYPDLPIVALTAFAFDHDRVEALNAGCNDFITKPILKNTLLETIRKYVDIDA